MRRWLVCLAVILGLAPAVAFGQGLLIVESSDQPVRLPRPIVIWPPLPRPLPRPVPPLSYKIKELTVQARVVDQVAQVQVSQTFTNTGSTTMQVAFVFPLPYDGAIEQMTLLVDGREYPAKLLGAEEARRMYEDIVRRNRDPALLEWMGTGLFRTNVFPVPAGASRTVSLRYAQLCRKQAGLTDFLFPLSTAKYTSEAPEKVEIRLAIESQEEIKNLYSPTHAVEIQRPDSRHATVTFTSKNEVPTSDFRLFYDVGSGKLSARVLSYRPNTGEDGYFLLLASPEIKAAAAQPQAKTVLFVVDRSGSMSGTKIEQVRSALKYVLNNLRDGDLFNIIAYDDRVETFRPELQRFSDETRRQAIGFIEGLYAGGSTNIDAALQAALGQLQDTKRPNYVIFLTDGLPTAGETNEMKIVANAKAANKTHARLFAFGVGYDLNSRLLDKLMRENFGQSEFVRPNENIENSVSRLYNRIESPVMTGVRMKFVLDEMKPEEGSPVNRVYPKETFDLFAGEQLVVVGRYKRPGAANVVVQGTVGQQSQEFSFPAELTAKSTDTSFAFIEKLWAMRRVGEILDEMDLKGKNNELVKELVDLATRHGILTPYTSFLADDRTDLHDRFANAARAGGRLEALGQTEGRSGVAQRSMKGYFQSANNAPAAAAPSDVAREAADAMSSGSGRGSGAGRAGSADAGNAQKELGAASRNVRQIADRTFFRRDNQWIDSQVTREQQNNAKRVKQFSDEYFKLAASHGRTISQYLVFDEPLLLKIDNQAYLIEP